jgi:hypothetical protein
MRCNEACLRADASTLERAWASLAAAQTAPPAQWEEARALAKAADRVMRTYMHVNVLP